MSGFIAGLVVSLILTSVDVDLFGYAVTLGMYTCVDVGVIRCEMIWDEQEQKIKRIVK